ncbi:hypothetical protein [Odoribacter laneus]|uniref:hypothetical protein n=1 Tax=Odoribacter laneus TaxID=626933 RepID=UPI003FEE6CE1
MKKDFIEVTPDQGNLDSELNVAVDGNVSFQAKNTSFSVSGGGITKAIGVSQFPNFPPVWGRYTNGKAVVGSFQNAIFTQVIDGIVEIDFQNPNRTFTYMMGFAVTNDTELVNGIKEHLSAKTDNETPIKVGSLPLDSSNFMVVGALVPVNGQSHIVDFYWDSILFFRYKITYEA